MPNPYDKYAPPGSLDELFQSAPRQPRPRRRRAQDPEELPVEEPEVPVEPAAPAEDKGWFQTYGPHVARGIGGFLGFNPITGALGGAGGEVAAQAIEQQDWTPELEPKRIAAETALGAAGGGFAKLLGSGVASVGRALGAGALLGGAAPIIRHGIEENNWDPREYAGEVGVGAALSGAVGGGLAKLFGMVRPTRPAGPASRYEIETTAVPGGTVLGGGSISAGKGGKTTLTGATRQMVNPVRPIRGTHGDATPNVDLAPTTRVPYDADDLSPIPEAGHEPYVGAPVQETSQQSASRLRAEALQDKATLEAKKLKEYQRLVDEGKRGELEPHLSESFSTVDPETGHRLGVSFREAAEEGEKKAAGEGGLGTLLNQADAPRTPEDIQAEIEAIRAELARTQGTNAPDTPFTPQTRFLGHGEGVEEGSRAPWFEYEIEPGKWTSTLGEDALRAKGLPIPEYPPDVPPTRLGGLDEPPLAGSPVPVEPGPRTPPLSGGAETLLPVAVPEPPANPLAELLSGRKPGRTRSKKTPEGFQSAVSKLLGQVEEGVPPTPGRTSQDLQELITGQHAVAPRLTRDLSKLDIQGADPTFQADLLRQQLGRNRAPEAPIVPEVLSANGLTGAEEDASEGLARSIERQMGWPEGGGPVQESPAINVTPEVRALPPATPDAPPDLLQILRTRVGATGKNYRLAKKAAEAGEIPTADYARAAHKTEQAAFTPPKPVDAPLPAPTPTNWMDDEAATIARLEAFPPEQRLAEFLKQGEAPAPPPIETPPVATPEGPTMTSDVEPEWVAKAMAEADELAKMQTAQPQTAAEAGETSDLDKLLAGTGGQPPPTAEKVSELMALLQKSGAVKNPADMPSWLRNIVSTAPEAPPTAKPATPSGLTKPGQEGKPRLNKGGKYGGHDGPPNPQDYRPTPPKNPERGAYTGALATHLGLGLAGAAVGGATDPLGDPVLSALAGGTIGLSIPTMAKGLMAMGAIPDVVQNAIQDLNLPDGVQRAVAKVGRVLPQWQRAMYLADVVGLPANAWVGPYGSGVFGALEKAMMGDTRGWAVLNELKNPWNFLKEYPSAFTEARDLVGRAEGFSESEAVGAFEKGLTWPGTALTGGDVAIRRILERHGFSDEEARIMTLTWEPFTKSGESLAHMRGLIPDITFPFKRTPINIIEQGLLRTPGAGFLMQGVGASRGTRAADPFAQQLRMQGLGLGIGLGSEQLSENMTPEQARLARRFMTNAAGPYSLLAGAGIAAGQAQRRGQPVVGTTLRTTTQQLPMPSIEPIQDALNVGAKLVDQGPDAIRLPQDVPRGAWPSGLAPSNIQRQWDALASFFEGDPPMPPTRRPNRRRRSQ